MIKSFRRFVATLLALAALMALAFAENPSGLPALPTLDCEAARDWPRGEGIRLSLQAETMPRDRTTGICYIPVDADLEAIQTDLDASWQIRRTQCTAGDLWSADGFILCAERNGEQRSARVVLTRLPVLCIDTAGGEPPGDGDMAGTMTMVDLDAMGRTRVTRTPVEINVRGNTSRRFPKLCYRLKVLDGSGKKRNLSIAGLRSDDDWILNAMYSDTSKVREALAYRLWEEINSSGQAATGSRFAYAEVLLNGEYVGLYGVQERIDRKQLDTDRDWGIIYKVTANDRPSAQALLACDDPERCGGFELVFSGERVRSPWAPAADYSALLDGAEPPGNSRLSIGNAVDFCLWSALVQARDNHFKNQFIHCVPEGGGYTLYRVPWDLNHTFGDLWRGDSPETNYVEYDVTRLALDDAAARLGAAGADEFSRALAARWQALRAGPIREDTLLDRAHALYARIRPAIERDTARWPRCGMGEGSAANIRDIEDYVRVILPRMDMWIETLANHAGETETDTYGENMDR